MGWMQRSPAQPHLRHLAAAQPHMRGDALARSDIPIDRDDLRVPVSVPRSVDEDGPYSCGRRSDVAASCVFLHDPPTPEMDWMFDVTTSVMPNDRVERPLRSPIPNRRARKTLR